jgi:hypothetical protein
MVCRKHFEALTHAKEDGKSWDEIHEEAKTCPGCIAARKKEADDRQQHETIRPDAPYGQHIAIRCTVCGMEGTTKNILPLGCRTIFISCEHSVADVEVKL